MVDPTQRLKTLMIEDSVDDAELILRELGRAGLQVEALRVESEGAMREALDRTVWDVILCDYAMPHFRMERALQILQQRGLDIPFIMVSGTVGEEHAVRAMRAGCHDYIMKDHLPLLAPAIERELRDVAERRARRQAELALRESEAKYRELVENANSIILRMDTCGRITFFNEYAQRFFGYSTAEILGESALGTIFPPVADRGAAADSLFVELTEHPDREATRENENIRRDGRRVWVAWTNKAIRDEAGRVTGILCIGTDLTERRAAEAQRHRLEQQLQNAQKLESLGVMAGGIAHDFNNLLTVIRGNAELLAESKRLTAEERAAVANIQTAGEHATALTRSLQSFSRPSAATLRVLDANKAVREAFNMLRRVVPTGIRFTLDLHAEPCLIKVDPTQIQQVLVNLGINARDAMPDGGELIMQTRTIAVSDLPPEARTLVPAQPVVCIQVTDTGTGIPEEVLPQIFDPFFTTKAKDMGTGLGLAIVYRIVEQAGGTVLVRSKMGRGTTFEILLPHVQGEPEEPPVSPLTARTGSGRILVIESEQMLAGVVKTVLENRGYEVVNARNVQEALNACGLDTPRFDLALVDRYLPNVDGLECLSLLRERNPALRGLVIGARSEQEEGPPPPLTHFISKPFSTAWLAEKVHEELHGRSLPGESRD